MLKHLLLKKFILENIFFSKYLSIFYKGDVHANKSFQRMAKLIWTRSESEFLEI